MKTLIIILILSSISLSTGLSAREHKAEKRSSHQSSAIKRHGREDGPRLRQNRQKQVTSRSAEPRLRAQLPDGRMPRSPNGNQQRHSQAAPRQDSGTSGRSQPGAGRYDRSHQNDHRLHGRSDSPRKDINGGFQRGEVRINSDHRPERYYGQRDRKQTHLPRHMPERRGLNRHHRSHRDDFRYDQHRWILGQQRHRRHVEHIPNQLHRYRDRHFRGSHKYGIWHARHNHYHYDYRYRYQFNPYQWYDDYYYHAYFNWRWDQPDHGMYYSYYMDPYYCPDHFAEFVATLAIGAIIFGW